MTTPCKPNCPPLKKGCFGVRVSVETPVVKKPCAEVGDLGIADHPSLKQNWDPATCVLASSIDLRFLLFQRSTEYEIFGQCPFYLPRGWGEDFALVEYLPILSHRKATNFSRTRRHLVSVATPPKYNLDLLDQGLTALIVDVRRNHTLFHGEAIEVEADWSGQATITIDASRPSKAQYNQFVEELDSGDEDDIEYFGGTEVVKPNEVVVTAPESNNGFMRIR